MINFIEGQLNTGMTNILAASDEDLNTLAEEGLIESGRPAEARFTTTSKQRRIACDLAFSSV